MMERTEPTTTKPRTLIAFVFSVDVAALAALVTLPAANLSGQALTMLLLVALAALVGARAVRIPSLRTEMTATHPFVFLALAALGPLAAGLVAVAGVVGAAIGRGRRPSAMRLPFNLGAILLSTAAASWAFLALGGRPGQSLLSLMSPLVAATAAYFAANTGLVAAAIALEKHQAFFSTWRKSFLWTAVSYFTGLTLAVAMYALLDALVPWGLVLGLPPCLLLLAFYRAHAAKLDLGGIDPHRSVTGQDGIRARYRTAPLA